jgi:hypothetical protein
MPFVCTKCGASFPKNQGLQLHLKRKKPCELIINDEPNIKNRCKYCNRIYSRSDNLSRHIKICKVANTEDGMEQLMDHTLKQQLIAQSHEMARMKSEMKKMTELMSQQAVSSKTAAEATSSTLSDSAGNASTPMITNIGTLNTGPVTINTQINTQISIRSWEGTDRLVIPTAMLVAAFTQNPRLVDYCRLPDSEKVDAELAAPYVVETLVDLLRRAHSDPVGRNVYLSPKRADQVMVFDETSWKTITLVEAIRVLCDTIADRIRRACTTDSERRLMPLEVQAAVAWVPALYQDSADDYLERVRPQMSAHLANTAPKPPLELAQK